MTIRKIIKLFILTVGILTAVACTNTPADPAPIVERYIEAKAESDENTIRSLICADMESMIEIETLTFQGIEGVEVVDMSCQQSGGSGVVACNGRITALYGSEVNEFPLTNYKVVQEDGEWKWCGEAG